MNIDMDEYVRPELKGIGGREAKRERGGRDGTRGEREGRGKRRERGKRRRERRRGKDEIECGGVSEARY